VSELLGGVISFTIQMKTTEKKLAMNKTTPSSTINARVFSSTEFDLLRLLE
jgi:hypothetical protein